jgi:hypothetical protein
MLYRVHLHMSGASCLIPPNLLEKKQSCRLYW